MVAVVTDKLLLDAGCKSSDIMLIYRLNNGKLVLKFIVLKSLVLEDIAVEKCTVFETVENQQHDGFAQSCLHAFGISTLR